jgi:hypothetical protein
MKNNLKRRDFLAGCFKASAASIVLAGSNSLPGMDMMQDEKPDPKQLEYCGYKCPADCLLRKATAENNPELKKKAYEDFKFKEKYKVDFDADKVFCYSCKVKDKPLGLPVSSCTVRQCVISKGLDCCIQCDTLAKCDKQLWKEFPRLKDHVLDLQKKFRS